MNLKNRGIDDAAIQEKEVRIDVNNSQFEVLQSIVTLFNSLILFHLKGRNPIVVLDVCAMMIKRWLGLFPFSLDARMPMSKEDDLC